jgi:hypothetical protein
VGAAVGAYLTIDLSKKQNAAMRDIIALKAKRDANDEELRKARASHDLIEGDVNRLMSQWGHQWDAPNSGPIQGDPRGIQIGVGAGQGAAKHEADLKKPGPVMFVFSDADKEASRYIGDFQALVMAPNVTGLMLTREAYPGENATWPAGVYRLRESIPYAWKQIFLELQTLRTLAEQNRIDEEAKLVIQEQHIAESQKALNLRLAELNGDPAADEKASNEVKLGLVESIRQLEVERNKVLKDVDTLRRAISNSYQELEEKLQENRDKVESMAPPTGTASSDVKTRR